MTGFEITRGLVVFFLGTIGALLSIYSFWESRGRGFRKIKVSIETAIPTSEKFELGDSYICITAVNHGHRDVTLTDLGAELPGKKAIALLENDTFPGLSDTRFPTKLADGEIAVRYIPYQSVNYLLRDGSFGKKPRIKPFAVDSTGRRHYGKKIRWTVE